MAERLTRVPMAGDGASTIKFGSTKMLKNKDARVLKPKKAKILKSKKAKAGEFKFK